MTIEGGGKAGECGIQEAWKSGRRDRLGQILLISSGFTHMEAIGELDKSCGKHESPTGMSSMKMKRRNWYQKYRQVFIFIFLKKLS